MCLKGDPHIKERIESELAAVFLSNRDETRLSAKQNILKIQQENRKCYNKKCKEPKRYNEDDLVAIQRTQLGPGLKLAQKYLDPYIITVCETTDI